MAACGCHHCLAMEVVEFSKEIPFVLITFLRNPCPPKVISVTIKDNLYEIRVAGVVDFVLAMVEVGGRRIDKV